MPNFCVVAASMLKYSSPRPPTQDLKQLLAKYGTVVSTVMLKKNGNCGVGLARYKIESA